MIKHLVISGGAYNGLCVLGALHRLSQKNFYSIKNIESIFATSIGAVLGAVLCMKIEWGDLIDYVVNRPWDKLVTFTPDMLLQIISKKGLFGTSLIKEALVHLLRAKDLSPDITLSEFYQWAGIELHLFAVRVKDFEIADLSYQSHPDLKLVDAAYMTCSLPFIFQPMFLDDTYYIDGGTTNNFPLNFCLDAGAKEDEILALKVETEHDNIRVAPEDNIFHYGYYLFDKLVRKTNALSNEDILNTVRVRCAPTNLDTGAAVLSDPELRKNYIEKGTTFAELFLSYRCEDNPRNNLSNRSVQELG